METPALWQSTMCRQVSELLYANDRVRGLWLSGSLARGDADRWSDVDFVVAVDDQLIGETAAELEASLTRAFDIVLLRSRGFDTFHLLNVVTLDWQRMDFSLYASVAFPDSKLRGLRRVFDKDMIGGHLEGTPSPAAPASMEQVDFTLTEFARVLGLLPVVLGRDDLVGAVSGACLLRDHLIMLLQSELVGQLARGALNLTAQLTSDGVDALLRLPALAADRASILGFHRACFVAFLEHGRRGAVGYQARWPTWLIDALHARLAHEFGDEFVESR